MNWEGQLVKKAEMGLGLWGGGQGALFGGNVLFLYSQLLPLSKIPK